MIAPSALALLACPACHASLDDRSAAAPGQAGLSCTGCGRLYPIVDGIPVLLIERARCKDA